MQPRADCMAQKHRPHQSIKMYLKESKVLPWSILPSHSQSPGSGQCRIGEVRGSCHRQCTSIAHAGPFDCGIFQSNTTNVSAKSTCMTHYTYKCTKTQSQGKIKLVLFLPVLDITANGRQTRGTKASPRGHPLKLWWRATPLFLAIHRAVRSCHGLDPLSQFSLRVACLCV